MESITRTMNEISLEDEEEGGIALGEIGGIGGGDNEVQQEMCDAKLCLVGKFLTEGIYDFPAMQHTLAALWKPGRGVYIKALEANLFLFQFYHEIDIKRVIDGSPWSFNRKVLLIARMQENVNPRCMPLNTLDLWVQIHDMQPGFMSEKIIMEVGNQIGTYVSSCPNNYKGVWREYMRIRITMDISKPLRRRMKVRKSGNEWSWINFKYENVPTFCFICGVMGHSDKFCSRIFEVPEAEITKPYGVWMRAPLRRQNNLIGSKWLKDGTGSRMTGEGSAGGGRGMSDKETVGKEISIAKITEGDGVGVKIGNKLQQNIATGDISGVSKVDSLTVSGNIIKETFSVILENKKRKTGTGGGK